MDLLKIEIDVRGVFEVFVGLLFVVMQVVWCWMLCKIGVWICSQMVKEVSGVMGIQQKLLWQWMYFFMCLLDMGKVWFGLNLIEVYWFGVVC